MACRRQPVFTLFRGNSFIKVASDQLNLSKSSKPPGSAQLPEIVLWHVVDSPFSRFSEGIRSIKVASDQLNLSKSNKLVGVTSARPNEGKSTIAISLAQLMAQSKSAVILIDCDIRNPSLSRHSRRAQALVWSRSFLGKQRLRMWSGPIPIPVWSSSLQS